MNLPIDNARGQCYDEAATMAGVRKGVATQIKEINSKCLYTHCYGHALNLAVGDAVKTVDCLKKTFETARDICKLIKRSPMRNTKLDEIRSETKNESRGIHAFCPTRWTVRGEALASILNNFKELMDLWEWSLGVFHDTDIKARIRGATALMPTFDFVFGCALGELLLKQTDNLSRTLQDPSMSAAEGNALAQDVIKTIAKDRNDGSFDLFWERLMKRKDHLNAHEPKLPRKRKLPERYEPGNTATYAFVTTPKEHYKMIYYEAFDCVIACIKDRFDQPDYRKYVSLQNLLLKGVKSQCWESEMEEVIQIYGGDVRRYSLEAQLPLLAQTAVSMGHDIERFSVKDLVKLLQDLDNPRRLALSEVIKLGKLLLVMPATNAISERSFSALKRVKTYLRSTTTNNRLNHLMVLHVHKDRVDTLNLVSVANEFVGHSDARKYNFGKFSPLDIKSALSSETKSTQT